MAQSSCSLGFCTVACGMLRPRHSLGPCSSLILLSLLCFLLLRPQAPRAKFKRNVCKRQVKEGEGADRGSFRMGLSTKFGKEIPLRNLPEKRSVLRKRLRESRKQPQPSRISWHSRLRAFEGFVLDESFSDRCLLGLARRGRGTRTGPLAS